MPQIAHELAPVTTAHGDPPTASSPQDPAMMSETPKELEPSCDVPDMAVNVPSVRELYFFNARVRSARDGLPTAICDIFMIDSDNDVPIASLALGQKFLHPNAPVNAHFMVRCRDTQEEITRGTVSERRGYNKTKRTRSGKEYLKKKWIDPVEQRVVLGEWTNWRRFLTPTRLDYDMSHWDEPEDDPETGKPMAPFKERFYYYLVRRHQLLTCFFVCASDSFSRYERFADLTNTIFWTWSLTIFLSKDKTTIIVRIITVALFMTPLSVIFKIACRTQCCGMEWGRVVSIPIWLVGLFCAISFPINGMDGRQWEDNEIERFAYSFFGSLAFEWFFKRPGGIAMRVWLYGKGWNKWIGIGPKSKWWFDKAVSAAGLE